VTPPPKGLTEIRAFYGDVKIERDPQGGWRIISPIAWEPANCVLMVDEPDMPVRRLYVNAKIREPLLAALRECRLRAPDYVIRTIGCFSKRPKRTAGLPPGVVGWPSLSMHAVAAAVDINANTNPMRKPLTTDMPPEFIEAWESVGWTWGGRFPTPDPMHWQWGSGV
jgi:hypothetical protein